MILQPCEAYFGDLRWLILCELRKGTVSVDIVVAWITLDYFMDDLRKLRSRNVAVRIVCTKGVHFHNQRSQVEELEALGIQIYPITLPRKNNYMHHKYAVIDGRTTLSGSFNWSDNAGYNFENVMIIRDNPQLAQTFVAETDTILRFSIHAMKQLRNPQKCPACRNQMVNLLLFDTIHHPSFECYGEISSFCVSCDEQVILKRDIQDPNLYFLLEALAENCQDPYSYVQNWAQVDHYMAQCYSSFEPPVHAVGRNASEMQHKDQWDYTVILWKNKFVAHLIEDKYDGHMGPDFSIRSL